MSTIYIWILIMGVAGIIDSIFLIPSDADKALSDTKSQNYKEAEAFYWKEFEKGNHSTEIIVPLAEINENEGNLNESISVMQAYAVEHPNDFYAQRRLADLYRANQMYPEYYQTLLKLQLLKTDWEVLQELAMWYRNSGEKDLLFSTLKKLILTGHGDDTDYLDLANLYAREDNFAEAYKLAKLRREFFTKRISINDIIFELWVAFELSKAEGGNPTLEKQTITMLADYLLKLKKPKISYYALGFVQENYPQYTPTLIQLLTPQIKKSTYLQTLVLQLQWNTPQEKGKVVPQLKKLLSSKRITPQLRLFAFNVFLDQNQDDSLMKIISQLNPDNIDDSEIYNLSINAVTRNKPQLALKMMNVLGENFLKTQPRLATALALGAQDPNARELLNNLLETNQLIPSERYYFFKLASASNFEKETLEIGKYFVPFTGLEDYMLVDIALTYAQMKKQSDLYALIKESMPPLSSKTAQLPLAVLDISTHQTLKIAKWLQTDKSIKENSLNAFYSAAEIAKEYPFALYVSKLLTERYPSNNSTAYYGLALVRVGLFDNGLSVLRNVFEKYPDNAVIQQSYFSALLFAAKRDTAFHEELFTFMQEHENLDSISTQQLRDFGYAYLDILNDFSNGERIFYKLAQNSPPNSQEVQNLIYLWGPKTSPENIAWINKRVQDAPEDQLVHWMGILNYIGEHTLAIEKFQSFYEANEDLFIRNNKGMAELFLAYMDALTALKMHPELRCAIYQSLSLMSTRKQLEQLAGYAEEAVYPQARIRAWELIVEMEPQDPIAWQKLARATFDGHDYCKTLAVLDRFFILARNLDEDKVSFYEPLYEYGQSLKRHRHFCLADRFFNLAVEQIDAVEEPTIKMLEIKALALYELGRIRCPLAILYEVFEKTSRDPDAAASFANMLMTEGMLTGARDFLRVLKRPQNECCEAQL